jgi:uncharacterized protein
MEILLETNVRAATESARLDDCDDLYSSNDWLEFLERMDHGHRYLTVVDDAIGAAMTPVSPGEQVTSSRYSPRHLLCGRLADRDCVVAAPQAGYRNVPRATGSQAYKMLIDGILETFEDRIVVFPYLPEAAARGLREAGAHVEPMTWDTWLKLPGGDFDDFLRPLRSKRRRAIRSEMRRLAESGVRYEVGGIADCAAEAAELIVGHARKYDPGYRRPASDYVTYLEVCDRLLDAVVITGRHQGSLVGCAVYLRHAGRLWGRMAGFDYGHPAQRSMYFQLIFYSAIEFAYQTGITEINLGLVSYRAKILRGAELETLWIGFADADADRLALAKEGAREFWRLNSAELAP